MRSDCRRQFQTFPLYGFDGIQEAEIKLTFQCTLIPIMRVTERHQNWNSIDIHWNGKGALKWKFSIYEQYKVENPFIKLSHSASISICLFGVLRCWIHMWYLRNTCKFIWFNGPVEFVNVNGNISQKFQKAFGRKNLCV